MEVPARIQKLSMKFVLCLVGIFGHLRYAAGHGMLLDPPNRSSIWRFKANNPAFANATENWSDNEIYCGRQTFVATGLCGVCGDNFTDPVPRKNEDGGIYGQGIITGTYKSGQVIPLKVHLNTSHFGYFEMQLCAEDDISSHLRESCYEKHLLEIISPSNTDSWLQNTNRWTKAGAQNKEHSVQQFKNPTNNMCASPSTTTPKPTTVAASTTPKVTNKPASTTGSTVVTSPKPNGRITKYYIKTATIHPQDAPVEHLFSVKLPKGIKCNKCVLRWQYTTGNDWGQCEDGTWKKGCGRQETFRNCADISIL